MVLGNEHKVQRPHFGFHSSIDFIDSEFAQFLAAGMSNEHVMRPFQNLPIRRRSKCFSISFSSSAKAADGALSEKWPVLIPDRPFEISGSECGGFHILATSASCAKRTHDNRCG